VQIRPRVASVQKVKYNTFDFIYLFIYLFIIYIYFFGNSPTGQNPRRILTHDGSKDAFLRKGVLWGVKSVKINSEPSEPIFMPPKRHILAKKVDLENFRPKTA